MTTSGPDEILATVQRAFDEVQGERTRRLTRHDDLGADLALDSLDFIDLVSVLGEELPPEAIDAVLEAVGELRTVGDVVDRFVALGVTRAG
jgi:acyl carrier protein